MDTVIHGNRNTNRWVIDLHAFITLGFRMAAEAIKSFICQSEIPGLSQEGGQADFLQKVESLLSFSSPRAFQKWTEFDRQNLAGTRQQLGLLLGSEASTGGHALMQEQDRKIFNLNQNRASFLFFPLPFSPVRQHAFNI